MCRPFHALARSLSNGKPRSENSDRTFYEGWICHCGTPLRLKTDQGRQFESDLFKSLNRLTGTTHLHTTSYHPQANGMVECLRRQLKAAIRGHENSQWTRVLPTVLLGIRSAWKGDMKATAAELVYGLPLRLPSQFLTPSTTNERHSAAFLQGLRGYMQQLRPSEPKRHGTDKTFVFKDLATAQHVFTRHYSVKKALEMLYDGPYTVGGTNITLEQPSNLVIPPQPAVQRVETPPSLQAPNNQPQQLRRSQRQVKFVDRYQAGFSL
ncbi:uncharacterized protein LOC117181244 [Belonocnema kinseyi]|uniref:uncharacterized protein LOC117181244 n=1 Tax=Belonocnema kinseyi TaxID=2817044 RepID=UPI00143CC46F|nr:uncharacterized protein LOC117181244 [Belonocnema kinseyi]